MASANDPNRHHTVQMNFESMTGQSMWSDGKAAATLSTNLDTHFETSRASDSVSTDLVLFGRFGASAELDADMTMGLRLEAQANGGTVSISCPLRVKFDYPNYIPSQAGLVTAFRLDTSTLIDSTASLSTNSPDAWVAMSAHAKGFFSLKTEVEAFSRTLLDISLAQGTAQSPFDASHDLARLSLSQIIQQGLDQIPLEYPSGDPVQQPIIKGDLNFPVINASGGRDANCQSLTAEGSDSLLGLNFDITNLITYIINKATEVPVPLNNELSFPEDSGKDGANTKQGDSSDLFKVSLSYAILDLYLRGELGFKQQFKFTPQPKLLLRCSDGRGNSVLPHRTHTEVGDTPVLLDPVTPTDKVAVGTPLWFYMPPTGAVKVEATLVYEASFSNRTAVYISGGVEFDPLSLSLTGEVAGISLPSFEFTPIELGTSAQTDFTLGTFQPTIQLTKTQDAATPFSIVAQNPPLAAIGRLTPEKSKPYNSDNRAGIEAIEDCPDLQVYVTTDGDAWPAMASRNPKMTFRWDGREELTVNDCAADPVTGLSRVLLIIRAELLTPGPHTITSSVVYQDSSTIDISHPLERHSTVTFNVSYHRPALDGFTLINQDGDQETITALDVVDGSRSDHGQGKGCITLRADGSGFAADTVLDINGQIVPRNKGSAVGPTQLWFRLTPEQLSRPRNLTIRAVSMQDDGQALTSDSRRIVVRGRTPALAPIREECVARWDGPDTWVTLSGNDFLPGCTVLVNGTACKTLYGSRTQVQVQIPAALLALTDAEWAAARLAALPTMTAQVCNARVDTTLDPNNHLSNVIVLPIRPQPPRITGLSTPVLPFAHDAFLTVTGSGLFPTTQLTVGTPGWIVDADPGTATRTSLRFKIPAAGLLTAGANALSVRTVDHGLAAAKASTRVEAPVCIYGGTPGKWSLLAAANLDGQRLGIDVLAADQATVYGLSTVSHKVYAMGLAPTRAAGFSQIGEGALGIAAAGRDRLYKLGTDGVLYQYAGGAWTAMARTLAAPLRLVPGATCLYVPCADGSLAVYSNAAIAQIDPPSAYRGHVALGDVLHAIGPDGLVYRYYQGPPQTWKSTGGEPMRRLVAGYGYLFGETQTGQGRLYDGKGWRPLGELGRSYVLGRETLYVLRGNGTLVAYSTATGAVTGIGTMCGGCVAVDTHVVALINPTA